MLSDDLRILVDACEDVPELGLLVGEFTLGADSKTHGGGLTCRDIPGEKFTLGLEGLQALLREHPNCHLCLYQAEFGDDIYTSSLARVANMARIYSEEAKSMRPRSSNAALIMRRCNEMRMNLESERAQPTLATYLKKVLERIEEKRREAANILSSAWIPALYKDLAESLFADDYGIPWGHFSALDGLQEKAPLGISTQVEELIARESWVLVYMDRDRLASYPASFQALRSACHIGGQVYLFPAPAAIFYVKRLWSKDRRYFCEVDKEEIEKVKDAVSVLFTPGDADGPYSSLKGAFEAAKAL